MNKEIICTVCPRGCRIMVQGDGENVLSAEGYGCKRGLEYAHGLQDIICKNENKLTGILNGIDVDSYNPSKDSALFAQFTPDALENKKICKAELQKMLGLPVKDVPMIAMISRLVSHKGLELVKSVAEDILHEDVQFVLLGTGEAEYEEYFKALEYRYPEKVRTILEFNKDLSKEIYAGSDLFLMPSKSEPCGLSQMIASRYATVPIVRETGGLADTIHPYNPESGEGNGVTFATYNAHDMLHAIRRAILGFKSKEGWQILVSRALSCDNSWNKSANEYISMYKSID